MKPASFTIELLFAIADMNKIPYPGHIDIYPATNSIAVGVNEYKDLVMWVNELSQLTEWVNTANDRYEYKDAYHITSDWKIRGVKVEFTNLHKFTDDGSDPGNCSTCHFHHK